MTTGRRKLGTPDHRELHAAPAKHRPHAPVITNITFERAPKGSDEEMLGWVSFDVDGDVRIYGVELYVGSRGHVQLVYPTSDMHGRPRLGVIASNRAHLAILDAVCAFLALDRPGRGRRRRGGS